MTMAGATVHLRLAVVLAVVPGWSAPAQPLIMDLGSLPGLESTFPTSVSADGAVVAGYSSSSGGGVRPFRWIQGVGMVNLGTPAGSSFSVGAGVSLDGQAVVGSTVTTSLESAHAFRWTPTGGFQDLGALPGTSRSSAFAARHDGSAVVGDSGPMLYTQAFRWTAGGGMVSLGAVSDYSFASDVTPNGLVVVGGTGSHPVGGHPNTGDERAFWWTSAGGMVRLPEFLDGRKSYAVAVSSDGVVVVGQGRPASGPIQSFRWTESGGMVNLGSLGGREVEARDVNGNGSVIVGMAETCCGQYAAFIWTPARGVEELGPYLISLGVNLSGWDLRSAASISQDGSTIVGRGILNGVPRAWIVTGLPATGVCYPDCDRDSLLTLFDFGCFQTKFASGDPYADCDQDKERTLADFGCFQTKFALGCP